VTGRREMVAGFLIVAIPLVSSWAVLEGQNHSSARATEKPAQSIKTTAPSPQTPLCSFDWCERWLWVFPGETNWTSPQNYGDDPVTLQIRYRGTPMHSSVLPCVVKYTVRGGSKIHAFVRFCPGGRLVFQFFSEAREPVRVKLIYGLAGPRK
jgi:hypothetical protein